MPHNNEAETSTWSAGFRLVSQRELSADERREVGRQAQACGIRGGGWLLLIPALYALCITATVLARQHGPVGALAASSALLLVALATPALLLLARSSLAWWRLLGRDARQGAADRFEGRVQDSPSGDGTLRRLRGMGLLQDYRAETQWFEVLALSGMVWRVNGARPPRLVRAGRAQVADVPPFAAVAAQWLEPLEGADEGAPHLGQRELSAAEHAELRRHLRRLTFRPLVALAFLLPWLVLVGLRARDEFPFSWMLLAAGCLVAQINLFRCFWLARKLGRDLRIGRLVIARSPVEHREPQAAQDVSLAPPEEFLPVSGIIWTRSGTPAPWRVSAAP